MSFVDVRFHLPRTFCEFLHEQKPSFGFGTFSEVVYYRTYSRVMENGAQEQWADTVIRVVEGIMSIRQDWYAKMHIVWDESYWTAFAKDLAWAIFTMKMLPPGRGLWAMGTEYVYQRGSASLFNCAAVDYKDDLAGSSAWVMDMLMLGVGVGGSTQNAHFPQPRKPSLTDQLGYYIPDTREGWVESTRLLIESYYGGRDVAFDYSLIRPEGAPLRGFGGYASGPQPLIDLHVQLRQFLNHHAEEFNPTRLIADVMNAIGGCVVAGNVRRSAELITGSIFDETFLNLKNYVLNPEREEIGWMSNNSVVLANSDEFEHIPRIAQGIRANGEPGLINLINIQKYARVGKRKDDAANLMNPCAEICLEDRELCNLVEVFPTRCNDLSEFWHILELATFYASTVSLLPTHEPSTNMVIMRNRRIGVSVSGVADWLDATNLSHVTMALRKGYENHVEPTNTRLAKEAGVPASIRLTTVKPSGTISLLAGVSAGMHWPVARYVVRRIRVANTSPIIPVLSQAGFIGEPDTYSTNTTVFAFPLAAGSGNTRAVSEVSIWEQASLVAMLQREWADNSVSNTLTFRRAEEDQIERVLAAFAPLVKSISMLPDQDERQAERGVHYAQPPYEAISRGEYGEMQAHVGEIDWSAFTGSDGMDNKFCTNEVCDI